MAIRRFRSRDGLDLVADLHGPADGSPVLLTHGGGQTRHAWNRTGSRLAEAGFQVVNLDLRGHGDSGWASDGDYTLDAFVRDIEDVASQVTMGSIALVGASLGGMASLIAAGDGRAAVSELVLVDVVPRVEPAGAERIRAFMLAQPDGFGSLAEVADAVAAYIPERPRPKSTAGLEKNLRLRNGRYYWHWDPNFTGSRGVSNGAGPSRMEQAARRLTCPTLLVRGLLSDVVSPAGVEHLRTLIPSVKTCDVADAGHMVAGDRNDVFAAAVLEFLRAPVRSDG